MAVGAVVEPIVVISLLAFGTFINRNKSQHGYGLSSTSSLSSRRVYWQATKHDPEPSLGFLEKGRRSDSQEPLSTPGSSRSSSEADLTIHVDSLNKRKRTLRFLGWEREVTTPNTSVFKDRFLSRVLQQLPFLVEVWYWALIYWVCIPDLGYLWHHMHRIIFLTLGSGIPTWPRHHRNIFADIHG
jgi:hypothetical protein